MWRRLHKAPEVQERIKAFRATAPNTVDPTKLSLRMVWPCRKNWRSQSLVHGHPDQLKSRRCFTSSKMVMRLKVTSESFGAWPGRYCGLHTRLGAWMKQNMGALVPRNAPLGSSPGFNSNTPLASALQSWSF